MAESVRIVAQYDIELSNFDAKVKEIETGLAVVEKSNKDTTNSTKQLTAATGVLAEKVGTLAVNEKAAAAGGEELSKALKDSAQSSAAFGGQVTKTQGILGKIVRGFKDFGAGARDGFRTAIKEVGGFSGISSQLGAKFKGIGASLTSTTTGVGKAFGQLGKGVTDVASKVPFIGGFAAALGPVGIAAVAAAGGLLSIVKNTDAGATALQGLGKTGGVVFDRVTGVVGKFFDTLTSGTGVIGGTFDFLAGAVDVFINKLTPIGAIFDAISETSLFKALKEDFEFGQQIANQLDELDDKQRDVNLTVAENEIGIRKNLSALRDTTKSAEERLKIADEITEAEKQNLAAKKGLLRTELGILQAQASRQQASKGEVDDSLKQQINDINIALANAEADSVSLTERVSARRAGIVEAEEQRKAAARAKALAAREKAEAEQAKKSEQRAQAEKGINEQLSALALEQADRVLTAEQLEVEAVKRKYADIEKATLEGIAKLREASPPNAQSQITAKEAEAIIAIEKAKNAELAALESKRVEEQGKTREEALETLRKQLLDSTELEREAVLEQLDEQVALAEKNIENIEERDKVIEELTKQAQAKLTTIVTDEEQKRIDKAKAAAEEQARIAQESGALLAGFAEQSLALIVQSAASGQQVSEEASKQLLVLLFDTLEKIILMNAINAQTGAIAFGTSTGNPVAGILLGVALSALIKGLFGAAKGAILGNFDGDPYVGGDGSKPTWSGRDGYLRRLDKGERVVRTKTNEKHYDGLEAMERGIFDDWVHKNYVLPAMDGIHINDDAKVVNYSRGDIGQRMAQSITLPRMFDKGMVGAINSTRKEQQSTNALLQALVNNTRPRRTNPRYN